MFISTPVYESLLDAGVQLIDKGDGTVDLITGSDQTSAEVQIKTWTRPIGPALITQLAARQQGTSSLLLIAPSFSTEARREIEDRKWSWIAAPLNGLLAGRLQVPGRDPVYIGSTGNAEALEATSSARGRKPWQRYAIIRHLLLGNGWSQSDLVEVCQVTQARVSQVLKKLLADGFVARSVPIGPQSPARWVVVDHARLIDHWLLHYPGPGGAAPTYWLGLDDIVDQAAAVCAHLERAVPAKGHLRTPVVSGDAAADFIAPYRRSQIAVVYSPSGVDLSPAGLTPAPREHATLKLVVPTDTSVWPHPLDDRSRELAPNAPYGLADPLQVAWDLLESDRPDADQAAHAVRQALIELKARDQQP